MLVTEAYLERLIEIQKRTVRSYFLYAAVLVSVGVVIFLCALLISIPAELNKPLMTIAGTFVASLAAVPIKDITPRREKQATLELLKSGIRDAEQARDLDRSMELQKVAETIVKKILEG